MSFPDTVSLTKGQNLALIFLMRNVGITDRSERLFVVSELIDREVMSFTELALGDWRKIRDMAFEDSWSDNEWIIRSSFKNTVGGLRNAFSESTGQLPLIPWEG